MEIGNIQTYIEENPSAIIIGQVPLNAVIEKIKRDTHAYDMPTGDIPNLWMHRFNAYHLPSNEKLNLSEEELQIKAIRIPITDATKHYTAKNFVSMNRCEEGKEDYIYLAYEEQTRYLYSNSNKLFLEAVLARGVSEEDIAEKTEEYTSYLFYLQNYLEGK